MSLSTDETKIKTGLQYLGAPNINLSQIHPLDEQYRGAFFARCPVDKGWKPSTIAQRYKLAKAPITNEICVFELCLAPDFDEYRVQMIESGVVPDKYAKTSYFFNKKLTEKFHEHARYAEPDDLYVLFDYKIEKGQIDNPILRIEIYGDYKIDGERVSFRMAELERRLERLKKLKASELESALWSEFAEINKKRTQNKK